MQDKIIIVTVVVVALIGHAMIYLWVKFKVDEATILKFLKEVPERGAHNAESISENVHFSTARVSKVCQKSKAIQRNVQDNTWYLIADENN